MWFKLAGADFSKNNLGTMSSISSSYLIDYTGLTGMSGSPSSVSYAGSPAGTSMTASVVVTVTSGYTFKQGSTITASGGKSGTVFTADKDYTSEQPITFSMAITANTKLTGVAEATGGSSSGGGNTGGDSGGNGGGEPDTPVNPPSSDFIEVPYTSQLSASGLSKTDGSILSSGTGYVNVYENLDFNKTYYASGYAPGATGSNACVCYYKADGTFISAESGSDWGVSSAKYEHRLLNIPANTAIIKLFGRINSGEGCTLEIGANYTLISHSEINEKSNLTETDGTLGTSSTGVVKTYKNIDASKTYVADGFCPKTTGTAAFVCYYNSSNAFISSQDGNDFGLSSQAASKVTLTVPSGTSTIKLFGQSGSSDPYLYTLE